MTIIILIRQLSLEDSSLREQLIEAENNRFRDLLLGGQPDDLLI